MVQDFLTMNRRRKRQRKTVNSTNRQKELYNITYFILVLSSAHLVSNCTRHTLLDASVDSPLAKYHTQDSCNILEDLLKLCLFPPPLLRHTPPVIETCVWVERRSNKLRRKSYRKKNLKFKSKVKHKYRLMGMVSSHFVK